MPGSGGGPSGVTFSLPPLPPLPSPLAPLRLSFSFASSANFSIASFALVFASSLNDSTWTLPSSCKLILVTP